MQPCKPRRGRERVCSAGRRLLRPAADAACGTHVAMATHREPLTNSPANTLTNLNVYMREVPKHVYTEYWPNELPFSSLSPQEMLPYQPFLCCCCSFLVYTLSLPSPLISYVSRYSGTRHPAHPFPRPGRSHPAAHLRTLFSRSANYLQSQHHVLSTEDAYAYIIFKTMLAP